MEDGPSNAVRDTQIITSGRVEETPVDAEPTGEPTITITKSVTHAKKSAMAKRKKLTRAAQLASGYNSVPESEYGDESAAVMRTTNTQRRAPTPFTRRTPTPESELEHNSPHSPTAGRIEARPNTSGANGQNGTSGRARGTAANPEPPNELAQTIAKFEKATVTDLVS